ncbi:Aerobic-type carbon monoxide dehydrogenase [Caenispirillum salinarum AK4]|uniref:Aerobic-type carbon monoxide dehydrogenase n=1 Tax=Caenispirillum salinarum AK4 TaxID=1238182 RepID=K9H3G8_9PROT|nr:xanthine dehydrogenase family protein molybdopterin-binding subunit [Caenispirillum salinarum]EKV32820.1 Aerobic-type carbon monoxide dehydrogenase [Caenispirillum salinarum AK4]
MGRFGAGQAIRRVEDQRFLTGTGHYTDDIAPAGQVHGVTVRSSFAHGKIRELDVESAREMPGVLAVLTAADLEADDIGDLPTIVRPRNAAGEKMPVPPRPVLARDTVRFVGEPVAFVVAETLQQARDAAEAVVLDVEDLPVVGGLSAASADGAPEVWPDLAPGNVLVDWSMGDADATEAAFAKADRVVSLDLVNNRLAPTPLEPRGALGEYDAAEERFTLTTGSQGSHTLQGWLCQSVLKVPPEKLRVISPDVGGGFGMRLFLFNEHALVLAAARKVGRPVKWVAERTEGFLADTHGRDHLSHAELALDAEGRFLGMRVDTRANVGAYVSQMGAFVPTMAGTAMLPGVYTIPTAYARVRVMTTNTAPVDAYRGAGRPEASYVIERLADAAAEATGLPRDEIRRRNFIPSDAMPYKTALGRTYDSGEFARLMDEAMRRAGWAGFEDRRADAARRGRLRGIGMSYYVEACGGGGDETAHVHLDRRGNATVLIGSQSSGQGHETAYAQMVAAELGLPMDRIRVVQGDTQVVPTGKGTGGSRSLPVGGASLSQAVDKVVETGKAVAARLLEVPVDDVTFDAGTFRARGTNAVRSLAEVAAAAFDESPDADAPGIREQAAWTPPEATYPNGCHICEVEIDPETGQTCIVGYTVADDMGVVLNPMLLRGQIIGGIVQGAGQALLEEVVYDEDSGQLVTGTMLDYAMPRADLLPDIDFSTVEIPCRTNILGVKGAGEAGTIGAAPAVMNAVLDALRPAGVHDIQMPATPLKVWQALQAAAGRAAAE